LRVVTTGTGDDLRADRTGPTDRAVARLATAADAPAAVRLALVMFASMGLPDPGDEWRANATAQFAQRVGTDLTGAVVDHPTLAGRLIASGAATLSTRLPTPTNPTGGYGYIQWIATDDEFRSRGCARAVMTTLLDWLDARGVTAIELHATAMGEPLYRSLGFWEGLGPSPLRRRTWDPTPG
jgi:ribosomal protein S18 acetylase RimI-like enzyme